MSATSKTGYCNGSDMLLYVKGKAIGHCTTHTTTITSDTRERAVKPLASEDISAGLFKDVSVVGLSASISFSGLVFYNETEEGYAELMDEIMKGLPVEVKCMEREKSDAPYLTGNFIIASLKCTHKAGEDSEYEGELNNTGAFSYVKSAITQVPATA